MIFLARIQKKIRKNLKPKTQESATTKPKEKAGKDYLLIAVITFTVLVMIVGWSTFTNMNRALYLLLTLSLSLTYVRRHFNLTDVQELWVDRGSLFSMVAALIVFAIIMYNQVFG